MTLFLAVISIVNCTYRLASTKYVRFLSRKAGLQRKTLSGRACTLVIPQNPHALSDNELESVPSGEVSKPSITGLLFPGYVSTFNKGSVMMKRILVLIVLCIVSACSSSSSNPTPTGKQQGDLDATFNAPDGYALYEGWNKDSYMGTAIQLDGKILVSTGISNGTDSDVAVLRYNPDGSLDTTFGTGGVFTYDSGNGNDCGRLIAVDVDGQITLTGYSNNGNDLDVLLMRLNSNGILDPSFGTDGIVLFDNAGRDDYGRSIAVQGDGSILVTARSSGGGTSIAMILRFDWTGALDTSFGTEGVVTYQGPKGNDGFRDLAVRPDGKIVVTGYTNTDAGFEILTARYNASGSLDTAFGTDGIVQYDGGHGNAGARGMLIQEDGKIVVSGSNSNGTDLDVIVLRYTADGLLDPEFGSAGVVTYDSGTGNDNGRRMALQQEGKIVVVGNTHNGTDYDALVLRYDSDGVADEDFGEAGVATYNLGQGDDWGEAVAVQRDQNIVAVGGIGSTPTQVLTMRIIGAPQG